MFIRLNRTTKWILMVVVDIYLLVYYYNIIQKWYQNKNTIFQNNHLEMKKLQIHVSLNNTSLFLGKSGQEQYGWKSLTVKSTFV